MFTLHQQTPIKHVQSGENKLQPTPTNANKGNTVIQQNSNRLVCWSLLAFVFVVWIGLKSYMVSIRADPPYTQNTQAA